MLRKSLLPVLVLTMCALILTACPSSDPEPEPAAPAAAESADTEQPAEPTEAPAEEETTADAADPEPTEPPAEEAAADAAAAEPTDAPTEEAVVEAEPRTFIIATDESSASYIVQEEFLGGALAKLGINAGNYEIVGMTPGVSGEMQLDLANATIGENRFVVDLTGLKTDQDRRDKWVQTDAPQFGTFPEAVFVASSIENAPADYVEGTEATFQMVGDLTVRETTTPITFNVTATLDGDTITGSGTADVTFTDFGMSAPNFANTLTVAEAFQIQVDFTAQAN